MLNLLAYLENVDVPVSMKPAPTISRGQCRSSCEALRKPKPKELTRNKEIL
jgi:hypothetical protein